MNKKDKITFRLIKEHNDEGLKRYKTDWLSCNFGWVVDENDNAIASKVYNRRMVFISKINPSNRIVKHNEEEY